MTFVRIDGFKGLIYVPEEAHGNKKHSCPDCFSCGFCSDERCRLCLKKKSDSVNADSSCEILSNNIQEK